MPRTVNPEDHAARRRHLLAAARTCFARKGFHQTSTAEICAAAGVTSGHLFHYFPTKKAIVAAIVTDEGEETARYLADLLGQDDIPAALRGFLDLVVTLAGDRDYAGLALEISAEAGRDAEIGALAAADDKALREGLRRLLAEAARRGQIAAAIAPADAAHGIAALIDGIFARVAIDPDFRPDRQRPVFQAMLGCFLVAPHG